MSCDISELKAFQKKLERLTSRGVHEFLESASKKIAAEFLRRVIKRTPVEESTTYKFRVLGGIASLSTVPGALRRGWTGDIKQTPENYLTSVPVINYGNVYQIYLSNPVYYAPYVNFGHKQNVGQFVPYIGDEVNGVRQGAQLVKGFVPGQHFMEKSAMEIQEMAPMMADKLVYDFFVKQL